MEKRYVKAYEELFKMNQFISDPLGEARKMLEIVKTKKDVLTFEEMVYQLESTVEEIKRSGRED